jgi:GDPmannose 4,6-dehydratase
VTRKISHAAAAIRLGLQDHVVLGNLDAGRDWGSAKDFVDCFWRSLQSPQADDYVIGTGQISTVRNLLDIAFGHVGLDWQKHVQQDARLLRPLESRPMQADSSKAQSQLGWTLSQSVSQWLCEMVDHDLRLLQTPDHRS